MGTKIEQSWRARRGPQTVYVLAWPGHSRTFHLSLYQSGQTPVSSSRLQPEPSTLFHDVRQHFPYSACYYSARYQGRGGDDRGEIGECSARIESTTSISPRGSMTPVWLVWPRPARIDLVLRLADRIYAHTVAITHLWLSTAPLIAAIHACASSACKICVTHIALPFAST